MPNNEKKYYAAKLVSPRPTFPFDMSDHERQLMQEHSKFWQELLENDKAIVVGPVLDPNGAYGFGIVIAESEEEARLLLKDDPALKISKYEIYQMLALLPTK